MSKDNAGVYFYGTPSTVQQITAFADRAEVMTAMDGIKTKVSIRWPDVALSITIDPQWNREIQLSGIRGWIDRFPDQEKHSSAVKNFLTRLDKTVTCYGVVIMPGYDHQGKAVKLLKNILGKSGGFFFSHQSFYDLQGIRIIGLPEDPNKLGPK